MRLVLRAGSVFVLSVIATLLVAAQAPTPAIPAGPTSSAPSPSLALTALAQLEPGLWQLDIKGRAPKSVCVADGSELIQVEHDQPGCSRFVVANEPKSATVHYSCQAAGWGRTTIRVETARLVQVQTQGIARNAPFDSTLQARRVGVCTAPAAVKPR